MKLTVPAHLQRKTFGYHVAYPEHAPREQDPCFKDFEAYRRRTVATAKCTVGQHRNDYSECDGGLELHHHFIEFALTNEVDLAWLERDYPGISDPNSVGAWVESGKNLLWLCEKHHRGVGGVHSTTAADWEGEKYVRGLIEP